nr:ABC transporter substrate-binding protein [Liquorilactobacillus sicerae]
MILHQATLQKELAVYQIGISAPNQQTVVIKLDKPIAYFKVLMAYPYSYISYLAYNFKDHDSQKRQALNNRNLRLALSLAIDRQVLTKKVLGDGSYLPKGFVAKGLADDPQTGKDFADQQTVKNTVAYRPTLAKKYWEKALQETGLKKLKLTLLASNDDSSSSVVAQYLQSQYAKVLPGLSITIRSVPGNNALQKAQKGDFDLYLSGWGGDFNDPITFLQIPVTGTSYNYGDYSNTKYDALIQQAQNQDANNSTKRWQDLVAAARIFNQDQGVTPIYQQVTSYLQKSDVKGIIHNTAGTQWNYKYAYKK